MVKMAIIFIDELSYRAARARLLESFASSMVVRYSCLAMRWPIYKRSVVYK